jgi:hypothetical protein
MNATHNHFSGHLHCVIKVRGQLSSDWNDYFDNLIITADGEFTLISGIIEDQAALHGILAKICNLGLPLSFVECTECGSSLRYL